MHNKALWTSFLFKHGSWCVSFTCLSFCSCKMTSQTVEEKTLTNKLSLVPFLFLYFPFLLQFILLLVLFFLFLFSFSLHWSLLTCLGVINFYFFWCTSCLKKENVHQDGEFSNEVMPIPKEDDKSPWEQYHIIFLSQIAMY